MTLSYSQASTFKHCGQQWFLEKRQRVSGPPWWSSVGGTAAHMMTEKIDLLDLGHEAPGYPADFQEAFEIAIQEELDSDRNKRLGYTTADFKSSGRKSARWRDGISRDWWEENGPIMLNRWKDWKSIAGYDVALADSGEPMIEVEFTLALDGTEVVGRIDRVMRHRQTGELVALDLKFGSNKPVAPDQLGVYGLALREMGFDVKAGLYWYGQDGGSSQIENLLWYDRPRLEAEYGIIQAQIDNNLVVPNPDRHCSFCGVRDWCYAMKGNRVTELGQIAPWAPKTEEN